MLIYRELKNATEIQTSLNFSHFAKYFHFPKETFYVVTKEAAEKMYFSFRLSRRVQSD